MIEQNQAEVAFTFHKKIMANEKKRRELFAENASILTLVFDKEYFKTILGDEEASWAAYLGEIEVFYTRNEVDTIIRIHKKFVKELHILAPEFSDIPHSRLLDMIPFVLTSTYLEWFAKARVLTGRDWLIEIRKEKGLLTEEEEHEHSMEIYEICSKCGKKHKVTLTHNELKKDDK